MKKGFSNLNRNVTTLTLTKVYKLKNKIGDIY